MRLPGLSKVKIKQNPATHISHSCVWGHLNLSQKVHFPLKLLAVQELIHDGRSHEFPEKVSKVVHEKLGDFRCLVEIVFCE